MQFSVIHKRAVHACTKLQEAESEMIFILQEIDADSGYRNLGYTSLTSYMIGELRFSEAGAHHFITVCRKAKKVPELQLALKQGSITISKAKTIAPVLKSENASHWLEIAKSSTVRELERQVAQENPETKRIEKIRHRARDQVEITLTVSEGTANIIKRAQELLRQKHQEPVRLAEVFHEVFDEFLNREDPLRKLAKKNPKNLSEREKATLRDQASCQFHMPNGKRCGSRYWLDIHHIKPKSEGGLDVFENLITLCSAHHHMVHDPPRTT